MLQRTQPKLLLSGKRESGALPAQKHKTCAIGVKFGGAGVAQSCAGRRRRGARLRRVAQARRNPCAGRRRGGARRRAGAVQCASMRGRRDGFKKLYASSSRVQVLGLRVRVESRQCELAKKNWFFDFFTTSLQNFL